MAYITFLRTVCHATITSMEACVKCRIPLHLRQRQCKYTFVTEAPHYKISPVNPGEFYTGTPLIRTPMGEK